MGKSLRILYAAGPGNVIGTYRHWREGRDDPTQISMTYSGQFYELCHRLGAHACVIATCRIPGQLRDGRMRIEHRPVPFEDSPGLLYHLGQFYWGIRLLLTALRFGANIAVVCAGTHWFMLWLLWLFGIKVVPTLHCVLWKKYNWRPTFFQRIVQRLNGKFFAGGCEAIISVSEEISQQVHELAGPRAQALVRQFVPQYRPGSFAEIQEPDPARRPFRVLFVGRIERNKGVFDVLEIAKRFTAEGRLDIEFDFCGAGSALRELRAAILDAGLGDRVRCHGHCDSEAMQAMYSRSHAVIVPTTSDFSEGFNKVVAEGVLAGRPVITSSVCPALACVHDAVVEVPPDDVPAYTEAIRELCDNRPFYESRRRACESARSQFYDQDSGWGAALSDVLVALGRLPASHARGNGQGLSSFRIPSDRPVATRLSEFGTAQTDSPPAHAYNQRVDAPARNNGMGDSLRIVYAAGPGDVLGTYRHWKAGKDDPSQVALTYSGQFYDLCHRIGAQAYVIASSHLPGYLRDGPITIEHRTIPFQNGPGALYHLGQVWSAIRLLWLAIWFRANLMIVVDGTLHWFVLRVARLLGIKVIPTIHCVLWRKGHPQKGVPRIISKLNAKFFTHGATAIMSASCDITQQLSQLTGGRTRPIYEFLPTYRREQFKDVGEPSCVRKPFRVLFAGRIERNKGVFDLLDIARRFAAEGRNDIEFDLCGAGGALAELKAAVEKAGVGERFRCHGHCNKPTMKEMFTRSHVIIVPTTSDFIEGFNQVVAEGVLSGRPVVTSEVCPALHYVRDAVVEVPPDDTRKYGDAILRLCDDVAFYEAKIAACNAAQEQFYDVSLSWGQIFLNILRDIGFLEQPQSQWVPRPAAEMKVHT